jgi:glutaredoxin-related protein
MKDPIHERIERGISEHDVVLFMKGTPVFPQCGFSSMVVQMLSHLGVKFKGIDVLSDPALRQGIKAFSEGQRFRSCMSNASSSAAAISSARCSKPENSPSCWPPET